MAYVPWVYASEAAPPPPPPTLQVTTSNLPAGRDEVAYAGVTFAATGGTAPYTWAFLAPNDTLPTGSLALAPTTGVFAGTPTSAGTFLLVAEVTDALGVKAVSGVLSLVIQAVSTGALQVDTTILPDGKRGVPYRTTLRASGGTLPYTWSVVAPNNVWPTGLTLTPSTGVVAGTPTVFHNKTMQVRVVDAAGVPAQADSGLLPITIDQVDAVTITTPANLPQGEVNTAYTRTFAATGGYGAKTWSVVAGAVPAWAAFNTTTGVLSGTPNAVATTNFTLRATDTEARVSADVQFSLTVAAEGTAEGPHDYFTDLQALTEIVGGATPNVGWWTLRDDTCLQTLIGPNYWPNRTWSYDPGGDTSPDAQDAVRFLMAHSLSTGYQLIADFPEDYSTGKLLITTDCYWAEECHSALANNLLQWKYHQIEGDSNKGSAGIYIEPRVDFNRDIGAQNIGHRDLRTYSQGDPRKMREFGQLQNTPFTPTGQGAVTVLDWEQRHSVWCRDWYEIHFSQPGTAFTEWNAAYSTVTPLGTATITNVAIDGADTLLTVDAGEVNVGTVEVPELINWWEDEVREGLLPGTTITIAGNSNPALNGEWRVVVAGNQLLRIVGTALAGSGGTASKHFHMFSWWHAEEDVEAFRMYYRVPIRMRNMGQIKEFRFEQNTSKGIEVLKGFFIQTPPTQAASTVMNIGAHDFATGDFGWVGGCSSITDGPYEVTVVSPTEISIPFTVTTEGELYPLPQPAIQRVDLGDAGSGNTFVLKFQDGLTPTITHNGGDMTTLLREACAAGSGLFRRTTVEAAGGALYDFTIDTTKSSTMQVITPVGFTPGTTTILQTPIGATYYSGTYGRVTRALRGYARNLVLLRDYTTDEGDPTFFRKPVR